MPLELQLEYDSGVPVYRQIYEGVVAALSRRSLAAREQLPTIHDLARTLDINPNTVIRAYRELELAGFIVSERGRGTFMSESAPKPPRRDAVLKDILKRALADATLHGISAEELIAYFQKELT